MTIDELIETLKTKRALFGGDCEVDGWGDQGGAMGLQLMKVVGRVNANEFKDDPNWLKYTEYCRHFNASTARKRDGDMEFLAEIRDDSASIEL